MGGSSQSGLFRIEENTGVIRLIPGVITLDRDKYELNVTATDDGKCCLEPGAPPVDPSTLHTSTAVVVVFITDVNDNKPVFEDCSSYSPKVEEGAPNGSPVIKVHAVDKDKGEICLLKFFLVIFGMFETIVVSEQGILREEKIFARKILREEKDAFFAKKNLRIYRSKI